MQATSALINSKKDQLKEELKQENLSPEQRAQYEKELAQWNSGGLILNAIGAGLAAPTNSIGGILAATASPAISHQIGQYFKVLAHKNQITGGKDELTASQETAHILAHAILGAAVAAAGGNDALAGGLAAAGAEATAPIVSKWLYGKNPADLTADEKATVSAIAGLTGAATGVTVGGSMADVAQGDQAGHIAVDNNTVLGDKIREYIENARQYWHTEQEAKDYLDVIRNVAVNAAMGSADSVIGTADYGIDSLNAVVYCLGFTPTYCSQSQETLTPKNQEIVNSVKTSLDVRTYKKLAELIAKAAQGDLLATEAAGELLASTLVNKKPKPTSINGAASVGKKVEKGVTGGGTKIEQILKRVNTWEQARNNALKLVGDLGPNSKPVIGRLELSSGYGKIVGRQSYDGKIGWRVDYDPEKGTHVNIWDFSKGKGPGKAIKQVIPFEGNEKTFQKILEQLNK
ncbi:hypothetical protein BGI40_08150 [Snodgrassella communis]|uniref:VENN motif pre-toxin domain-containing protein n=2 Tax=Snodgrassella communis TaxID=2946699 RepID=UPI000C1E5001|nr:VENN motif pre-toxin domain-containing protein [Snodgrassella communis]PIT12125.1 hypothetical protein BGI29_03650 [Snodgrassella communis]PIT29110.1 hypothetical protein BGI39_05165 [Snodgrassella communis]PIT29141.1 hypothetical protein BGI38_03970 [Snodgrassella communis]PIT33610.1 hypothetical protein BGI40_08150 [Snodgrassella communis]